MSKDPGSAAFVSTPLPLPRPYKTIRDNFTFTLVHQCFPGQNHKYLNIFPTTLKLTFIILGTFYLGQPQMGSSPTC